MPPTKPIGGGAALTARPRGTERTSFRRDRHATHRGGVTAAPYRPAGASDERSAMTYWVECDWCGKALYGKDQAVMEVHVERERTGKLEARWAEEVRPTLHFCAAPEVDYNRMGLTEGRPDDLDSCYQRAVSSIKGRKTEPPNLGMEWRLVPVAAETAAEGNVSDEQRKAASKWLRSFGGLTPRAHMALVRRGIDRATAERMSDEELLEITGVGLGTVRVLRAALEDSADPSIAEEA